MLFVCWLVVLGFALVCFGLVSCLLLCVGFGLFLLLGGCSACRLLALVSVAC